MDTVTSRSTWKPDACHGSIPAEMPKNDMVLSIRLASIFAHEDISIGKLSNEVQQYFPRKQGCPLNYKLRSEIIKFLSDNLFLLSQENISSQKILKELECLITQSSQKSSDRDLQITLKEHGWNGRQFVLSNSSCFDPNTLFLALLNLHLRSTDKEYPQKKISFEYENTGNIGVLDCSKKTQDSSFDFPNEEVALSEKDFYYEQVRSGSVKSYILRSTKSVLPCT